MNMLAMLATTLPSVLAAANGSAPVSPLMFRAAKTLLLAKEAPQAAPLVDQFVKQLTDKYSDQLESVLPMAAASFGLPADASILDIVEAVSAKIVQNAESAPLDLACECPKCNFVFLRRVQHL